MKKLPFLSAFVGILVSAIIATEAFDVNRFIVTAIIAAALFLLYSRSGLTREDIGVLHVSRKATWWSALVAGSICLFLSIVYLLAPSVLMDERYNQSFMKTIVSVLIVLPLTTVILEELAFRGVLLGYLLKSGSRTPALLISSILFGLWHIASSAYVHIDSVMFIHSPPQLLVSIAVVLVTGFAGLIFSLLRLKTDSILVPIVAHWSLNASGILFAWLAWQR